MRYAKQSVAERDTPALQWTSTFPPRDLTSFMKSMAVRKCILISAVELSSTGMVSYSNLSGQWFGQLGETLSSAVIPNRSSSSH